MTLVLLLQGTWFNLPLPDFTPSGWATVHLLLLWTAPSSLPHSVILLDSESPCPPQYAPEAQAHAHRATVVLLMLQPLSQSAMFWFDPFFQRSLMLNYSGSFFKTVNLLIVDTTQFSILFSIIYLLDTMWFHKWFEVAKLRTNKNE